MNKKENKIDNKIKDKEKPKRGRVTEIMEVSQEKKEISITDFIEIKPKRNKRVSYAITEETDKKLKEKCQKLNVSVNEVVNQLLESFVNE